MTSQFLNVTGIRRFCRARGRRISREYIRVLDLHIQKKLTSSCEVHNGNRRTLDVTVAAHVGIAI